MTSAKVGMRNVGSICEFFDKVSSESIPSLLYSGKTDALFCVFCILYVSLYI